MVFEPGSPSERWDFKKKKTKKNFFDYTILGSLFPLQYVPGIRHTFLL